jgi:hypothetical protein
MNTSLNNHKKITMKNLKSLVTCLLVTCFSYSLFAQVTTTITGDTIQLNAYKVITPGSLTTQTKLTAGSSTSNTRIILDGTAGTITSPSTTVSFGSDTLTTSTTVKAGAICINTSTVPSGYSLAVNGAVIATDIYVELYTSWPDYVFDKEYKHRTLDELESYLNINHHLPGMPSAKDVKDKGSISIGEIATQNTKEIEELTLDLIELNKKVKVLEEQNKMLLEEIHKQK